MSSSAGGNPNTPFDNLFRPPPSSTAVAGGGNFTAPYPAPPPSNYPAPGTFSYPPPTPPFHHHHHFIHYPHHDNNPLNIPPISYPPPSNPTPSNPNLNPNPNPNPGARLMALLGTTSPAHLETAVSMPPVAPAELAAPPMIHVAAPAMATAVSMKAPRGRHLAVGERAVHDVDSRLPGESQPPQLEVTPITKYTSDPGLVLGRQIAVNRTYICYGLKLGNIRVLNINTALRSLLKGHTQKVTDMAFFAENVHLLASASVDGRVFVWKIDEGPDVDNKPQITGGVVVAIQLVGDAESYHPRVCWHSHKQENLIVGIGKYVLKIDTTKVGRGKEFSADEPLKCSLDKLIDGVQLIGRHDGDVTDLSISQWMITRLASASKDGTVKIWDDRRSAPLAIMKPHDGQPVNSVSFLTAPHRPDHIVLITAGPLNREVKIWTSTSEEGWLLASESESWQCTQTLELRSSTESRHEDAFFNQVVVLPRSSLILLANAKKNAIYAVHLDYGHFPAATRMDYIADFTVAMPILSLTATSDSFSDGEQLVQVYCVQTQAIQQYALDLSQCLPPPTDNVGLVKDSSLPKISDTHSLEAISMADSTPVSTMNSHPGERTSIILSYPISSANSASSDTPVAIRVPEFTNPNVDLKPSAPPLSSADIDSPNSLPFSAPLHGAPSFSRSPSTGFDQGTGLVDRNVDQSVVDYSVERGVVTRSSSFGNIPSADGVPRKNDFNAGVSEIPAVASSHVMAKQGGNTTHLITPFEILSGAISTETSPIPQVPKGEETRDEYVIANSNADSEEVEVKVMENRVVPVVDPSSQKEQEVLADNIDCLHTSEVNVEGKEGFPLPRATLSAEDSRPSENVTVSEPIDQPPSVLEEVQDRLQDLPVKSSELSEREVTLTPATTKGKRQKGKQSQVSGPSSPSPSPFNSTGSLNEPGSSLGTLSDDMCYRISTIEETLNQLMTMQKEMQKQISTMVTVPVTKEGKRVEVALGRTMEKAVKANVDALWARVQEENAKHDKAERDRVQQMTNLITNSTNKDLPSILERALKKEISSVGPNLARAITPVVEKTISSAIVDSFQRGVGDKAVGQLEKAVSSKLETTVARQIQAQFQTSGKQALQEALRTTMESSVVPAFEASCKTMFEQVDSAFQKGMVEHTTAAQQKLDAAYTPLAVTLRDAINSASSITQNLFTELVDGQRKLLALVAAGSSKTSNPMVLQPSNGPLGGLQELVEAPLDPTKELTKLVSDRKFGEAFTLALQRSDVSIVSWLCSQVDLHAICSPSNLQSHLSQGVLLSLLQQLACDVASDTSRKLDWMTDVAAAINPVDPSISAHVRRIVEQVYNLLNMQRSQPMASTTDASKIRILMHVLTSILMSCK